MRKQKLLSGILLLLSLLPPSVVAMAQEIQSVSLDTEYTVAAWTYPKYSFTAPATGRIYMYCSNQYYPALWQSASFEEEIDMDVNAYNNPRWIYEVEAGHTYYLGYGLAAPMETITFHITMEGLAKIEALSVIPEENSVISVGNPVNVTFNVPVEIGSATISAANVEPVALTRNGYSNYAGFEVKDILYDWMTGGLVKENDEIRLTLTDVHSSSDESLKHGEMIFTWKACPVPVALVKSNLPDKLLNWAQGDSEGVAVFEFSGKLSDGAQAALINGDVSRGGTYEQLPVWVEGNNVYVDLTGVNRIPAVENTYALNIYNVCDAAGYPAYSSGAGTVGSYSFSIVFDGEPFFEPAIFMFSPDDNADIKGVDEIEIFVSNVTSAFQYTGATFDFTIDGFPNVITIDKKDIHEMNGGTEVMLTVNVPAKLAEADKGSNVLFSLVNGDVTVATVSYTYDGAAVEYRYSEVQLTGVNPDPTTTEIISAGDYVVTVTFSAPVSELHAVEPTGMGAGIVEYATSKADAAGTQWTFTIPASTINNAKGTFTVNMYAKDASGLVIWKSALYDEDTSSGISDALQAKDDTCFSLTFMSQVIPSVISNVAVNRGTNSEVFNLTGQKVNANYKGVVIIEGKKVKW